MNTMEHRRTRNLELYSIVLFSPHLQSTNDFLRRLQEKIDYIVICNSADTVKNYIYKNPDDSIVLVVSIELAETLTRELHEVKQLHQIYVYNPMDTISQCVDSYYKVHLVTNPEQLLTVLGTAVKTTNNNGESFIKHYQMTTEIWYPSFIRLLLKLNRENNDRQPFINYVKKYYEKNTTTMGHIIEFEQKYEADAIQWYTKSSFVVSLLNKAFRSRDFEVLILFRFFIADLYDQLSHVHKYQTFPTDMIYYRGQQMHRDQLESLEKKQLVCCTSFFSSTKDKQKACEI